MDPQLEFLAGEKILRPNTILRQSNMLSVEKIGSTRNIMTVVPMTPHRQVFPEKNLKEGLKFGADAR